MAMIQWPHLMPLICMMLRQQRVMTQDSWRKLEWRIPYQKYILSCTKRGFFQLSNYNAWVISLTCSYKSLIFDIRFSPPEDGSIAGGHQPPRNVAYWTVGCLGITKPCTSQCEKSFTACMGELQPPKDAKTRTFNWQKCLKRVYQLNH